MYLININKLISVIMPLFKITVKTAKNSNGVRLEKGISVDVVSNSFNNPVTINGGQMELILRKRELCLLFIWMCKE